MFANVLIANRGEIACRVIRTARRLGLRTIALHTPADRGALFTRLADEVHAIGKGADGYLDGEAILGVARDVGAQCLHPGYGFLSENADFAEECERAGVTFVGPPASAMRAMGLKNSAKILMQKAGAPVVPGYHGDNQAPKFLREKAYEIGYPVLIKAIAGGGGRGMRRVDAHADFELALDSATREAQAAFSDARVLIEKYVPSPRHIEMQIFGDSFGDCVHLFERDCSLQRRHQKIIEECPAPGLPEATRAAMAKAAVEAAKAVGYAGAGTVEFIVDSSRGLNVGDFYFLEMNTRLQVEHPVTEAVTGLDLVEWQFRIAAGERLPLKQSEIPCRGAAFEARLYAEDPQSGFLPSPGIIRALKLGEGSQEGLRVDAGVEAGDVVTPFYDPMIAKLIVHGATREQALARLTQALDHALVIGPKTNLAFLASLCRAREVAIGAYDTGLIDANLARLGAATGPPDGAAVIAATRAALAMAARAEHRALAPHDPWGVADSFELTGARRLGLEIRIDGKPERLMRGGADGPNALFFADGHFVARQDEAKTTLLETPEGVFAFRAGRQHFVELVDPLERSAGEGGNADGAILAPMHGRLAALDVEDGEDVEEGQRLAVVEAMKMEHALKAPSAGRVTGLSARAGDQVEMGAVLMRIEA
jgi:3-methylcrotonyl-CoA carboxylase alpha subunit